MRSIEALPGRLAIPAAQNIEEKNYWLTKLSGELIKASFPGDYNKRVKNTRRIDTAAYTLPGELFSRLLELSKDSDARIFVTIVAGVMLLLNRYTYNRQEDIAVGTAIYRQERNHDFINTVLVLRNQVSPGTTFKEFLIHVGQVIREANLYQNYPIEALLQLLDMSPTADEDFPLFDVTVIMENIHDKKYLSHIHFNTFFIFKRNDEGMELTVEYNSLLYKKSTIERLVSHYFRLLKNALFNVNSRVFEIDILSGKEKKEILFEFNDTKADYSMDKTMHQLFEEQAAQTSGNIAVICGDISLTYAQLNQRANQLAWELRKRGLMPNRFVAIIIDRSIEMVVGVMAILKAGGAYVPLEPYLPETRVIACLSSLNVESLLTNRLQLSMLAPLCEQLPGLKYVFCLDEMPEEKGIIELFKNKELILPEQIENNPGKNPVSTAASSDIAYVIFTSGTTGTPKGVVLKHRPVVNIIEWVNKTYNVNTSDKLLFITSLSFDLSVYDIFGILASGAAIRLARNEEIISPERLVEIIFNEGITFWDSAPAALQMLVPYLQNTTGTGLNTIKSKVRLIFLSGDWIPMTLPDILKKSFEGVTVISLGGATEAAIWSNFYPIETVAPEWNSIPYGKPTQNAKYYILDQFLNPTPIGVPGDLYIGGECLATGYINDEALTAYKFIHNPFAPGEKMYKTGDLARWFPDGNIEFLGRLDHQVKIRGFRIELGEIENCLLRVRGVKEAVVLAREEDGRDKYICAYFISEREYERSELRESLLKELPEYMIPSYFVRMEKIPLTPNGKIDRSALPKPELISSEIYTAPGNEIEKKLVELWSEVLGTDALHASQLKDSLGINDNFFELGGHSLKVTILVSKIHKEFEVRVPLAEIFKSPTIKQLAEYIDRTAFDKFVSIEPIEKKEYYPLSAAQKRLYILQQMQLEGTAYNMPVFIPLEMGSDISKIEDAFKKLIVRHENFRTTFNMVNDEPVQRVHDEVKFEIFHHQLPADGAIFTIGSLIRPFDLARPPLLRVGLVKPMVEGTAAKNRHDRTFLFVDMHHIISDGVSNQILMKDFQALFEGEELLSLRIQYKDFSQWQNQLFRSVGIKTQEYYWLNRFKDDLSVLNLPLDFPRPAVRNYFEGDTIFFRVEKDLSLTLSNLVKETKASLYMVLLTLFNILLYKYTDQEDITVGTPIAGRNHSDLENIIGMFVNLLAMRNRPEGNKTFMNLLEEVRENALKAYENQDYQFEQLVNQLGLQGTANRNPLFDVVFTVMNVERPVSDIPGNTAKSFIYENHTTKFDLRLAASEGNDNITMSLTYSTILFKRITAEKMAARFIEILQQVLENTNIKLKDIVVSHALTSTKSNIFDEYQDSFDF
jgi:amino acid adenylation domain-containing protein